MFALALQERILQLNSRLCLGLDPRPEKHRSFEDLEVHTLEVLEACADTVACVKPQLAFFEALGLPGMALLERVCAQARALGLPVILDGKRGDIGSTAEAYARAWLGGAHAGSALTVNPYLGFETLLPFVHEARAQGGAVFVLVRTSNPGSGDLQNLEAGPARVAERVAREVARLGLEEGEGPSSVGAVVGATRPDELAHYRALMPQATLLLPGLGAQGADPAALAPAFLPGGVGAVVSASRGIQYADPQLSVRAAQQAAEGFRQALNAALAD
ncbi:orotidine-5'-phosphate decarboxylase [Deinobacterium chartae]|uniref:Orotidine 5'-phosphate decarboxylase n=1 Tax=Deinobacterium chartae TaxID=521158 RepID=A0A841I550_9DEIO|nr:orotidine-5'-phosphate decarboxylase [Deinobacterium chartae]MBB6099560.1 orotidine-5'-phosphate decarboxylase [Deinobacterium chartae]